jgi:hypothetical protein
VALVVALAGIEAVVEDEEEAVELHEVDEEHLGVEAEVVHQEPEVVLRQLL